MGARVHTYARSRSHLVNKHLDACDPPRGLELLHPSPLIFTDLQPSPAIYLKGVRQTRVNTIIVGVERISQHRMTMRPPSSLNHTPWPQATTSFCACLFKGYSCTFMAAYYRPKRVLTKCYMRTFYEHLKLHISYRWSHVD